MQPSFLGCGIEEEGGGELTELLESDDIVADVDIPVVAILPTGEELGPGRFGGGGGGGATADPKDAICLLRDMLPRPVLSGHHDDIAMDDDEIPKGSLHVFSFYKYKPVGLKSYGNSKTLSRLYSKKLIRQSFLLKKTQKSFTS